MNLIELSLKRPIAVVAGVIMVVLFGVVALQTIPIQLTPDVRRPVIDIATNWRGAAPAEVEREITNRIEEKLGGIDGVTELSSRSRHGGSRIRVEFKVGHDLDRGLLDVSNRLSLINDLPEEANEPEMYTRGTEDIPFAIFALLRNPGNNRDMESYGEFVQDVLVDRMERVPGVAGVDFRGGARREMRIVVQPEKMARYGVTVPEIVQALRGESASYTAGAVEEGKRRYVVRAEGEIQTAERARQIVLRTLRDAATGRMSRVTVGDIADVAFAYKERTTFRRYLGERTITLYAYRETGANVIEAMSQLRTVMAELNEYQLPAEGLRMVQVSDDTIYIDRAIDLVTQNIWIGGTLAALLLVLFLRSWRPTLIISLSIPISVVGAFVAMAALGRSINVISLAGIAFAIGMVVDAAIVVMENIFRHRQEGKSAFAAALAGTREVWPAVFASALTTVVVFVPILLLEMEVGQLFRDIAVAITVAVLLSLIVSVTVVPVLSHKFLGKLTSDGAARVRLPVIDGLATGFANLVMAITRAVTRSKLVSLALVGAVCGTTTVATVLFLPPLDFLPDGNKNAVWGRIQPPPGYNLKTTNEVANRIEAAVRPYWHTVSGPEDVPGQPPKIQNFFFVSTRDSAFIGASTVDPARAAELIPLLEGPVLAEPGTRASINQSSLFSRGIGGARSIRFDVSGPDLETNLEVARLADDRLQEVIPRSEGHRIRPRPGLELGAPEIRMFPKPDRLADAGVTFRELGQTVDAFNDGLRVAEITVGDRRMDLTLRGPEHIVRDTQGIGNLPVVTKDGQILQASQLADMRITNGPTEIWHLERTRYVTLQITPSKQIPLETTIGRIKEKLLDAMRAEGLPPGVKLRLSGAADNLTRAWNALRIDILVAVLIVFLVMAVTLESFLYPFIIMLSVPLATAGGVLGLFVLNRFIYQPLDMMTLLGFIILIGTVVNNAILLVTYSLHNARAEGMSPAEAIQSATRTRLRPIFMSTLTTVFGMLPLVVFPGAGSELYRGLGSVIVGGLALSAILTLLIIPPLLTLLMGRMRGETHLADTIPLAAE